MPVYSSAIIGRRPAKVCSPRNAPNGIPSSPLNSSARPDTRSESPMICQVALSPKRSSSTCITSELRELKELPKTRNLKELQEQWELRSELRELKELPKTRNLKELQE